MNPEISRIRKAKDEARIHALREAFDLLEAKEKKESERKEKLVRGERLPFADVLSVLARALESLLSEPIFAIHALNTLRFLICRLRRFDEMCKERKIFSSLKQASEIYQNIQHINHQIVISPRL